MYFSLNGEEAPSDDAATELLADILAEADEAEEIAQFPSGLHRALIDEYTV